MKSYRVFLSFLLAVCLLMNLTACGEKAEIRSGVVYVPEAVDFTSPLDRTESACIAGETVYLLGGIRDKKTFAEDFALVCVPLEGGAAEKLPGFQSAQFEDGGEYDPVSGYLRPGADGTLWVTETIYNPDSEDFLVLRQVDSEGNELFSFGGPELKAYLGAEYLYDLWTDGAGRFFANADGAVVILDENGEVQATLEGEDLSWKKFVPLADGRTAIPDVERSGEGLGVLLRVVDPEAGDWAEEAFSLSYGAKAFQTGEGDVLFYYISGDALCAWRQGAGEGERVISWAESGVDPNYMSSFAFLPDGRLVSVTGALMGFDSKVQLTVLTATDAASLPKRTVLELATLSFSSELRAAVADFNSSSQDCFISVTEYMPQTSGAYDANLREQAGLRMITALTAGEAPDIICLGGEDIPIRRMEDQGMLEDLWPYIDADPDLGRDALMIRPLEAMEYKGGLYRLATEFKIETLVGAKSVVGDGLTWTYDDFWAALETMPEGSTATGEAGYDCKTAMLEMLVKYNAPLFLDIENGTSDFEGEEFRTLLEFCSRFPDEPPEDMWPFVGLYYGEQMVYAYGVNHFVGLQQTKTLFGDEVSYVGWPNQMGRVGSSFTVYGLGLSIPTASAHKEEAWSFLRQQLLPHEEVSLKNEIGSPIHFPINREDFEKMAELATTPEIREVNGVMQEIPQDIVPVPGATEMIYCYALTQEDYDRFMELYNAAEGTSEYNSDTRRVVNIILEQAGPYFAGDKSLEDTAAAIQSRVGLYLAELQ